MIKVLSERIVSADNVNGDLILENVQSLKENHSHHMPSSHPEQNQPIK